MSDIITLHLGWGDWLHLFSYYLTLSLLSVGGAITTAPEMHRFLVGQQHWVNDAQFNAAIAIAQAAPGPNVLFVALLGWQVGLNSGGLLAALGGVVVSMLGIMLPSATFTYLASRWGHDNRELRAVRAFKQGMAPIVLALLVATAWLLASANSNPATDWPLWLATVLTTLIVWRTRLHMLWLLGAGAALGWFGLL